MRKTKSLLLLTLLATATASLTLSSCKKDDDPEITILSPVAGDYKGTEDCFPDDHYIVHIYNTADQANKVHIDNVYNIGEHLIADVNGTNITIQPTEIETPSASNPDTTYIGRISATGSVSGSILTLTVKVEAVTGGTDNAYVGECKFTGDRDYREPHLQGG